MKQINHLIPATLFIQQHEQDYHNGFINGMDLLRIFFSNSRFLQRPLEIGMFVPAVNGVPLKKPVKPLSPATDEEWDKWQSESVIYQEAQSKVLFEGFEFKSPHEIYHNGKLFWFTELRGVVEEIARVENNIKLTPAALKEIYNT